ncbi:UDP-glucose 4-epimerase [Methanobrevibacter cuticularis]|uniref:UDP-glucose 4-epimerase n=1 Tax=Methanobrevibacter cuticularis TaxID=47311 RepID=A0A166DXT9_9EURY|nr:NAD(P)-dependent oxidoreductase [Methanobrevibacter cuticularis]KZX16066.1 UDP-glucose 4-epimerase [Methanobrevibacter cuticularis]
MEKNILLTGGTGFIGSQLAEDLLNDGKNLILLKRSYSNTWRIDNFMNSFPNLKIIDIDKVKMSEIFNSYNIEGILHLATYYTKFHKSNDIKDMIYSNVTFPTDLLENSVNSNTKYFVNTGSFGEYSLDKIPITEKTRITPFNLYSSTKVAFEDILKFYNHEYGIKTSSLKLFTPYGPKDDENKIIPYLIRHSLKKEKITIQSTSKKLDVIFVSDIIDAYKKTMNNIEKFENNENINIANGTSYSIRDIYSIINSFLGNTDVTFLESDLTEVKGDITKANKLINWHPHINLKEGLKLTIEFYKDKLNR